MSTRAVLAPLAAIAVASCAPTMRGSPGPDLVLGRAAQQGELTFMTQCSMCHPRGEGGLAFSINDKPLPGGLIAFQVRNGLGAMPSFPESRISDTELNDLVTYLLEVRQNPPPTGG